jgi:Cdc6-like AAA superfamily ATPase
MTQNFDFHVNEENIHMDLAVLPSQIFEAGVIVADTRKALDELKRKLELLESQADSHVRNDPMSYGIVKITEAAIASAIETRADVQELKQQIINAKHANDVAYAAANALDAKRKSLESLVQLKSIGYYAARNAA